MKTPEEIRVSANKFCTKNNCLIHEEYCGYDCRVREFAESISHVMNDEEILESAKEYIKSISSLRKRTAVMRFAHSLCAYGEKLIDLKRSNGLTGHRYYVLPEESYDEALLNAIVELAKMHTSIFIHLKPKILASPEAFERIGSNEILGVPVKISYLIPYIRVYFED